MFELDATYLAFYFVIAFRVLAPFTIFRWPLFGAALSILADISDVMIFEAVGEPPIGWANYHPFDKFFDIYYLTFEFIYAFRFTDVLARRTSKVLYLWRLVGVVLFEITHIRPIFFLAPNIFENFFVTYLVIQKIKPKFVFTKKSLIITLFAVGIPKLGQEAIMHWLLPDRTWVFLRDHLFFWLYD